MGFGVLERGDGVSTPREIGLTKVCAGYQVAARNLFITIARLLYCFNFEYSGVC